MKIRVTKTDTSDAAVGIKVGDVYEAVSILLSDGAKPCYIISAPKQKTYYLAYNQVELVDGLKLN